MNIAGEIKYYLDKDYAKLKFSETKSTLSIDTVSVPFSHRGRGIGSALIQRILVLADGMQKDVYTSARPIGACSEEKLQGLIEFYQRFNFHVYDRGLTVAHMKRTALRSTAELLPDLVLDRNL